MTRFTSKVLTATSCFLAVHGGHNPHLAEHDFDKWMQQHYQLAHHQATQLFHTLDITHDGRLEPIDMGIHFKVMDYDRKI